MMETGNEKKKKKKTGNEMVPLRKLHNENGWPTHLRL